MGDLASIIGTLDSIRGRRDPNAAMWTIEAALRAAVSALAGRHDTCLPLHNGQSACAGDLL